MLTNPFTGQTVRRVSEDDELLVMESSYREGGALEAAAEGRQEEAGFDIADYDDVFRLPDG